MLCVLSVKTAMMSLPDRAKNSFHQNFFSISCFVQSNVGTIVLFISPAGCPFRSEIYVTKSEMAVMVVRKHVPFLFLIDAASLNVFNAGKVEAYMHLPMNTPVFTSNYTACQ